MRVLWLLLSQEQKLQSQNVADEGGTGTENLLHLRPLPKTPQRTHERLASKLFGYACYHTLQQLTQNVLVYGMCRYINII